jgi:hypothetical protein
LGRDVNRLIKSMGEYAKKLVIPRFAANGVAELECGRDNRMEGNEYVGEILAKDFTDGQG